MKFNKFYFFRISIFFGLVIYFFMFILNVINPDYSFGNPQLCVELVQYRLNLLDLSFKYPYSCDENFYYTGFEEFSKVFEETYNYQARPLYIFGGYVSFKITDFVINFINPSFEYTTQLSTFLYQLMIINSIVYIFYLSLKEKVKITNFDYFVFLIIIMINPIYKWGIFVPSHQTATLLLIAFFIYFASREMVVVDRNISLLFGLFFLFHRSFLISFLALILYKNMDKIFKIETYFKNLRYLIYFLLPNIIYESFIRFILQRPTYDANTEYWGQFVWLYDFLRGKVRYQSEWHCVTIPENFICYFNDLKQMIMYILIPILLIGVILIVNIFSERKKYPLIKEVLFISISLFSFWSLIGWYPPIRFNFYSVGHMVTMILLIFYISEKKGLLKSLILVSVISAYIFIPHWNTPEIVIDTGIFSIVSIVLISLFSILKLLERK